MQIISYRQITDYENAFNSYHFQLRKETYYSNTYKNFDEEIENIETSLNEKLYNYKKNFNIHSRQLLLKILELFNALDNYKNPNINTEKRNLQDYKDNQINRISECEYSIKTTFESLTVFDLHIKNLITYNEFLDAYSLRNYIKPKLGYYINYLSAFGIEISKTPLFENFNNLLDKIENSIDTDELKFINELNQISNKINYPNPINEQETNKIRLLHETGIIDFLIEKYPNSNPNQIAKFFELLSEKPMIASNNNALFTTDKTNIKYPMNNLSLTKKENIKSLMVRFGFVE